MGKENLKPFSKAKDITDAKELQRQKELQSKGGKKKAEYARMKKIIEELLKKTMRKGKSLTLNDINNFDEAKNANIDVKTKLAISLIQSSFRGDMKAFDTLLGLIGERPKEIIEVSKPDNSQILEISKQLKNIKIEGVDDVDSEE